jgi:NhaP-type Na+/H+ or K+/H+ antiporter
LALRLESGLNDVVLLPIVIAAMPFLAGSASVPWGRLVLNLFLLGPAAGVGVGLAAALLLDRMRRRVGVRRDYESIYSLGVAFAAFAGAEAVHGSGFLAAFAAGLTIVWLDVELCDCFLEYGETTAEMLLLFTFVLLGSGPIWDGLSLVDARLACFLLAALVARPVASYLSLLGTPMDRRTRVLISWYGPRGLSSLLLALLPVFAGLPGAQTIFLASCVVVLASVGLHGGSVMLLAWRSARPEASGPAPLRSGSASAGAELPVRMTLDELAELERGADPILLVDVRTDRSARESPDQAAGAVRLDPHAPGDLAGLDWPRTLWIALYCA